MSDEGRPGPDAAAVLSPNNFLSYIGATVSLLRAAGWKVILPFVALTAVLSMADLGARLSIENDDTLLGVRLGLLFALPLVGSMIAARTTRVLAPALAGENVSLKQAGVDLRGHRSHMLACGMIAMLLTFVLAQVNPLLGLIGPHLVLGPPLLVQVVGLEREPLGAAWRRVREMVRGQALRIFLYILCAALALVMFEVILAGLVFTLVANASSTDAGAIAGIPIEVISSGIGLGFMAAFGLVAYFDCRTRFEGLELDDLKRNEEVEEPDSDEA